VKDAIAPFSRDAIAEREPATLSKANHCHGERACVSDEDVVRSSASGLHLLARQA